MKEENNYTDLFDEYIAGALPEDKKLDFENRLTSDAAFKADFDQYKKDLELIRMMGVREEMGEFIKKASSTNARSRKLRYLIPLGLAASITLILLLLPSESIDNRALFDQHFSSYPNRVTSRDGSLGHDMAMNYYDQGLHKEAIAEWDRIALENDTALFYESISQLALGEAQSALSKLNQIKSGSIFASPAIWYKGLAFLLIDQKDSTRYYMQLVSPDSPNRTAAVKILDWLK